MKILFLSKRGDLLPLALSAKKEEHKVLLFIDAKEMRYRGEGMVEKSSFKGEVMPSSSLNRRGIETILKEAEPDFIISDVGMGQAADFCKSKGMRVWGSSRWGDNINQFPSYAKEILDLIEWKWERDDVLGGWWNGVGFTNSFLMKPTIGMMNGGYGEQVLTSLTLESPLNKDDSCRLSLLSGVLRQVSYFGPVLLGRGLFVGTHLPSLLCLSELLRGDVIDEILQSKQQRREKELSLGVLLSFCPYPFFGAIPRPLILPVGLEKHLHLLDVSSEWTGRAGDFAWVTAQGRDRREAGRRVQRTVENVRKGYEGLQVRTDF
jgi:hypothetical protein